MRGVALAAALLAACSGTLEDRCRSDADCGGGVCRAVEGVRLCLAPEVSLVIEGPGLVSRSARVPVRVDGEAPSLVAHATLDGASLPDPRVAGQEIVLDLPAGDDEAALHLVVEIPGTPVNAERDLVADLAAPRVQVTRPGVLLRGRPLALELTVEEAHDPTVEVALAAASDAAPTEPSAWTQVALEGGAGSVVLDAAALPLEGLEGDLAIHLRTRDAPGNEARSREDVETTRVLLDERLPARIGRPGPVALPGGDLLVPLEEAPWLVRVDATTRAIAPITGAPQLPLAGFAARDALAFAVAGPDVLLLDPSSLAELGRCTRLADPVVGPPVTGATGGVELAVATAASGRPVSFRRDGASGCAAVEGPLLGGRHAAARQVPDLEVLATGVDPALLVLAVGADGALRAGRLAPGPLTQLPVASDGVSVFVAQAGTLVAFDTGEGGDGPIPLRTAALPAAATASPLVLADAVIVPTLVGLSALPRTGAWESPRDLELPAEVLATPVASAGGTLFAVAGEALHAIELEAGAPVVRWSAPLPGGSDLPLLLGCDGVLAIAAGDRLRLVQLDAGPDPAAPWGQLLHDPGRTGNAGSPYCTSR